MAGYQARYLDQVQFVDRLVGELQASLERKGVWGRALVVLVADHGVAFRPGVSRRFVSRDNLAQVGSVPLFVKPPGVNSRRVSDGLATTVDVFPTIGDWLGTGWKGDGESLRDPIERDRVAVRFLWCDGGGFAGGWFCCVLQRSRTWQLRAGEAKGKRDAVLGGRAPRRAAVTSSPADTRPLRTPVTNSGTGPACGSDERGRRTRVTPTAKRTMSAPVFRGRRRSPGYRRERRRGASQRQSPTDEAMCTQAPALRSRTSTEPAKHEPLGVPGATRRSPPREPSPSPPPGGS